MTLLFTPEVCQQLDTGLLAFLVEKYRAELEERKHVSDRMRAEYANLVAEAKERGFNA